MNRSTSNALEKGIVGALRRLWGSTRYEDAPRHLFPFLVPKLPGALELVEPYRRRAHKPIDLVQLEKVLPPKKNEQHQYCPLCGFDAVRVMYNPRRFKKSGKLDYSYHVGRCPQCGLLYRVPGIRPQNVPDLYSGGNYATFLDGKYLSGRLLKYKRTLDAFGSFFKAGDGRTLLDFGCGTGVFLSMALERGFDAYGVDLAPDAVEVANERLGERRAWFGSPGDIDEIKDRKFDVITLWSVIAHFADPFEQIQDLYNRLEPGGVLVIYTVNAQALELKVYGDDWANFTRNHLMFWEPHTLSQLARKVGFEGIVFAPFLPQSIETNKWKFSKKDRSRVINYSTNKLDGNMMRALLIKAPSDQYQIKGLRRL